MGTMFREWKGARVSYNRQGYIFFISRNYRELSPEKRAVIDALCLKIGGKDYAAALMEFMTTDRLHAALSFQGHALPLCSAIL